MKPADKAEQETLRRVIAALPQDLAKQVRASGKKSGLLPGGGNADDDNRDDKPDKPDKPEKGKRP